jgi:hypothetical protein
MFPVITSVLDRIRCANDRGDSTFLRFRTVFVDFARFRDLDTFNDFGGFGSFDASDFEDFGVPGVDCAFGVLAFDARGVLGLDDRGVFGFDVFASDFTGSREDSDLELRFDFAGL